MPYTEEGILNKKIFVIEQQDYNQITVYDSNQNLLYWEFTKDEPHG